MQLLEPSFIPKLQNRFADFPNLHYSKSQRLLILETGCGYEYDQVGKCMIFRIFKEQPISTEQLKKWIAFSTVSPSRCVEQFQGQVLKDTPL